MPELGKNFKVLLTKGAERDLEAIYDYVVAFDSLQNANSLLDRLVAEIEGLAQLPQRGTSPQELIPLGIHEYRQIFFKPYQVIYRVLDRKVLIYVIADGRRDMQALLQRRLLGKT